jgi:DNA-directed RNA polymerase subunit RPC12/RpoP
MVVKLIKCPSCGEDIVLEDLFEGMEISCKLCGSVMHFRENRVLLLDTNEEFEIDELIQEEEEEIFDDDEFEEEEYFNETEYN